jgi:hypothetical protein
MVNSNNYVPESSILDLVNATIPFRKRLEWGSPAEHQDFPILNRALAKGMKATGGHKVEFRTALKKSTKGGFTGLYATREYNHEDYLVTGESPWAHLYTYWMYDGHETAMNRDPERIVDILEVGRHETMTKLAGIFEEACWQTIIGEATEFGSLRGIPYWVSKAGTTSLDRSANVLTTVGNINPTTYPLWANYVGTHTTPVADLVAGTIASSIEEDSLSLLNAMNLAQIKTKFKAPQNIAHIVDKNPLGNYKIYVNTAFSVAWGLILRHYNLGNNFGFDLAKFNGQHAFNGIPMETVEYLDLVADGGYGDETLQGKYPAYFINSNELETVVLRGYEFKESAPQLMPGNPNVAVTNVDFSVQLVCKNRKSQALVYGTA